MRRLRLILFIIVSLPKTILFNFLSFSIKDAIKLPVLVGYNFKIRTTKRGVISFEGKIKPFRVRFGFGGSNGVISNRRGEISIESGNILFKGKAGFAAGCSLRNTGYLTFGKTFNANKNAYINCCHSISIGESAMLGWNVVIMDGDGHPLIKDGEVMPFSKPISIGDHVWICAESHLLKGSQIGNNCVVAYRSLVTKGFDGDNLLIGGSPAKIIGSNTNWKE